MDMYDITPPDPLGGARDAQYFTGTLRAALRQEEQHCEATRHLGVGNPQRVTARRCRDVYQVLLREWEAVTSDVDRWHFEAGLVGGVQQTLRDWRFAESRGFAVTGVREAEYRLFCRVLSAYVGSTVNEVEKCGDTWDTLVSLRGN